MEEISASELRRIQMEILTEINDISLKEGINYSIAYGTLLGAIRHKGYIPWDDDIDLIMSSYDLKKLQEYYQNNNTKYKLACYNSMGDAYRKLQVKVYDPGTTIIEHNSKTTGIGVNIDIFVLYYIGDTWEDAINNYKKMRFCIECMVASNWNRFVINHKKKIMHNLARFFFFFISRFISYDFMYKSLMNYLNSLSSHKRYLISLGSPYRAKDIHDSELFDNYTKLSFENRFFSAISDYNSYLKRLYGNYMEYPPKEMQVTNHDFVSFFKDRT